VAKTCSSARNPTKRPTGIAEQQDEDKPCRGQKSPVTYEVGASLGDMRLSGAHGQGA